MQLLADHHLQHSLDFQEITHSHVFPHPGIWKYDSNSIALPETNIAPENGWLEYYFPFGARPIFRGKLAVSFREG